MQIYALGTGSFVVGALSMFMFSMGTVPLMFGLGALSTILSGKFTHKMMKVKCCFGNLAGGYDKPWLGIVRYFFFLLVAETKNDDRENGVAQIRNGVQTVTTELSSGRYEPIIVQKGIPVKWTIKAEKSNLTDATMRL